MFLQADDYKSAEIYSSSMCYTIMHLLKSLGVGLTYNVIAVYVLIGNKLILVKLGTKKIITTQKKNMSIPY